jgi:hypothetical protein
MEMMLEIGCCGLFVSIIYVFVYSDWAMLWFSNQYTSPLFVTSKYRPLKYDAGVNAMRRTKYLACYSPPQHSRDAPDLIADFSQPGNT